MELLNSISGFIMIALASSTPIILAAMGGLLSEKSGIVNIALEGKMLLGALAAVIVTFWTGSPWLGCLAAMIAGVFLALIHLLNCQFLNADHVVSGAAINIFALGFTGFLVFQVFASKSSAQVATIPNLDFDWVEIPVLKEIINFLFSGMSPLFIIALVVVIGLHRLFKMTSFGLRVRSIGESPAVAEARGVGVVRVRLLCLIASGALAGLAGAQLAVGDIGFFTEKMSAGRGFIALAAVIFGRWRPLPVLAASLFFGFAEALALRLKLNFQFLPDEFAQALPFILTLVVLALSRAASGMPTSLGQKAADKHLD